MANIEPEEDLTNVSSIDHQWLQFVGLVTKENALDYFANSPFYERTCNNEVCRMQRIPPDQIEAVMRTMTGKEYVLHSCQEPNLFVIKKQLRDSPDKVTPLSTYYIIDSVIYQAPSLRSVCNSRLVKSVFHLHNAFKEISEFVDFDPITNYQWNKDKFGDTLAPKETSSKYGKDPKKVEQVLRTLAQKYPLPKPPQPANAPNASATNPLKRPAEGEPEDSTAPKRLKTK
jgi:mediator of RNA polymerase II transcription subunit 6